jgi:protein arginine kinase activator
VTEPGKQCQFCHHPATVHLTDIIDEQKRVAHLCEACAAEHHLISDGPQEVNVAGLLQFLVGQSLVAKAPADANAIACPVCGAKYAHFRTQGRLGCPADYEVFRTALEPLLERIHHRTRHTGKTPSRYQRQPDEELLRDFREQLDVAVREEQFEEAARLLELIRCMGTPNESR